MVIDGSLVKSCLVYEKQIFDIICMNNVHEFLIDRGSANANVEVDQLRL